MKTNNDFKNEIEERYGKPLKEIMYELIIDRNMDQWSGSKELNISKELFVKWRTQLRLGPMQRQADIAESRQIQTIKQFKKELEDIELEREFNYREEKSIRGFKELIERMLELEKQQGIILNVDASSNLSMIIEIGILERIIDYLNKYEEKKLHEQYEFNLQIIKAAMLNHN